MLFPLGIRGFQPVLVWDTGGNVEARQVKTTRWFHDPSIEGKRKPGRQPAKKIKKK
jgi:hypothetical protein